MKWRNLRKDPFEGATGSKFSHSLYSLQQVKLQSCVVLTLKSGNSYTNSTYLNLRFSVIELRSNIVWYDPFFRSVKEEIFLGLCQLAL